MFSSLNAILVENRQHEIATNALLAHYHQERAATPLRTPSRSLARIRTITAAARGLASTPAQPATRTSR